MNTLFVAATCCRIHRVAVRTNLGSLAGMELVSVSCSHCGAPLEVGEQTRFVTCQFCKNRLAVKHSGSAAYTEVIEQIAENTQQMASNLRVIELQNELERVDREWDSEKSRFYVTDKHGHQSKPSIAVGLVILFMMGAFGIFFAATSSQFGAPAIFPLFGIGFVVIAIISAVSMFTKASGLSVAESGYQRRRAELLSRLEAARAERD